LLLLLRVGGWFDRRLISNPLLWILHAGYLMIALGFLLRATLPLTGLSPFIYVHALTVGGIGLLTLGMMSRVSLGHTGRPLTLPKVMSIAFCALLLAVIVRVFVMAFVQKTFLYDVAATFWVLAFGIYIFTYFPALVSPRVDGK
ncbi:NnrS family protein, partial [Oceanospirillum sp. HFRX-1_2]